MDAGQRVSLAQEAFDRTHGGEDLQGADVDDGGVGMLEGTREPVEEPDADAVAEEFPGEGKADGSGADDQDVGPRVGGHGLRLGLFGVLFL
jgi:hypothetical protein